MRVQQLITLFLAFFVGSSHAFQMKPTNCQNLKSMNVPSPTVQTPQQDQLEVGTDALQRIKSNVAMKLLPAAVALSVSSPVWAADPAPEMSAAFLPAILVPVVGIVFPAFSMALFFLYTQANDLETI